MESSSRHAPSSLAQAMRPFGLANVESHALAIQESHQRCRALGLTEDSVPDFNPWSAYGVRHGREPHQRLLEHAMPAMEMLCEQIRHTQSIVALADSHGNTLHVTGDNSFLERVQQVSLSPGVDWSEAAKGTNALGTALFTEAPTLVHGKEHFLLANHFLTCSAAPIFDHTGQLMGVLDVSGHHQSYHPHTLAMVSMAARMIENHWFSDKFRNGLRLHFQFQRELLGTLREGMVAVSPEGHILGANRAALDLLGLNMPALRNLGLDAVFGIGLGRIADHCRQHADEPMQLHLQQGLLAGQPVYARALFNWPTFWPTVSLATGVAIDPECAAASATPEATAQSTLQAQELAAIRSAVSAANGNISRAARQLGVARNTIYRKLRAAGLEGADPETAAPVTAP